jgi:tripartite-type tricarboxylate transporter receptor subunit TctC
VAATLLAFAATSNAEDAAWPSRSIRIITPTTPGSSTDYFARVLGQYVQAQTGQPVVVDNKPGGSTIIGAEAAKNAPPDGYTFFVGSVSSHSANPALYTKLPYEPTRDFVEVGMFSVFPFVAVVRKDSPYRTIADVVDAARKNPGKLSCGYSTAASRVPCELIKVKADINVVTVSYKAAPQVLNDLAGGVLDFTVLDAMSASTGIKGGLLRPIAVTSPERSPSLPNVPAVAETLPGYVYEGWAGLSAPAGTPRAIVERMNRYMREESAKPEFRKVVEEGGATVRATTPEEQAAFITADRARWKEWVQVAKIPPID